MGLDQYRTEIIVGLVKREVRGRKKVVFRCNEACGLKTEIERFSDHYY